MSFPGVTPAPKGQIKCFRCRVSTRSRNGAWHDQQNQQVFLCAACSEAAIAQANLIKVPNSGPRAYRS